MELALLLHIYPEGVEELDGAYAVYADEQPVGFDIVESDDLAAYQKAPWRPIRGVDEALDRVREVTRGQLALLSFERGVALEVDALPDMEQVGLAVVRDLRHRLRGLRPELERPCEVLVIEQPLEDDLHDLCRIIVRRLRGIESGLLDLERDVQDLRGVGGKGGGRAHEHHQHD